MDSGRYQAFARNEDKTVGENMIDPEIQPQEQNNALESVVEQFHRGRQTKSYGDRHPELGKMIKCQVCNQRHRGSPCIAVYAKNEDGSERLADQGTNKGVYGAAKFKGRILKHRNAWGLQVLERALLLYRKDYEPYFKDKDEAGKMALVEAIRQKRAERAARRRKLNSVVKASRRGNRA